MSEEKPKQKQVNEPGNENPWYVMMTIAGEQKMPHGIIDMVLHAKNQRYWNGWAAQKLSKEQKNKLIAEGRATAEDLARLTEEENDIRNREIKSRCPSQELLLDEGKIDFSNNEFPNSFCCEGFTFPFEADFSNATFSQGAWFYKATFSKNAYFNGATFSKNAYFKESTFSEDARFREATFSRMVDFKEATFWEWADFTEVTFWEWAYFKKAIFSGRADFKEATFSLWAWFEEASFEEDANFTGAMFKVGARFNDSKFKSTSFNNAKFNGMPPEFYNANLHEDTDWTDIKWPKAPQERGHAIKSRRAYERLKLIMAQQNKFPDEYFFLRKELRCREIENPIYLLKKFGWREIKYIFLLLIKISRWRKVEKVVSLATLFSHFYRWFSDYGWSVGRPLFFLSAVWLIGFLSIYGIELLACKCINFWQSMGISAYNTFPFFHDTYFPKDISLSRSSIVVSGLQTVLGLVFLFLLGLGLRNRFRIK